MEVATNEETELIDKNKDKLGIINNYYWLGLTKEDSTWKWENEGDSDYTHWYSGEPDGSCNDGPPCNCAEIYSTSMEWADACCDTDINYVLCESNPLNSS